MAITYVASEYGHGSTTSQSCDKPTGVQENDIIIAAVNCNNNVTISDNNGSYPYTSAIANRNYNGTSCTYRIFYRVVGASDPSSYTFDVSSSNSLCVILSAYRGVDTSSPFDVQCSASTENLNVSPDLDTDVATNSLITQSDGAMIIAVGMGDTSAYTFTDNPGDSFNTRQNEGFYRLTSLADKVLASAGTQNSVSWTMSTAGRFATQIFSLKEAGAGGGLGADEFINHFVPKQNTLLRM